MKQIPDGLSQPVPLSDQAITGVIPDGAIGVYVLGFFSGGSFQAKHIGRSDASLRKELLKRVEGRSDVGFEYLLCDSPLKCFEEHCRLWHFYELSNLPHPTPPCESSMVCPCEGCSEVSELGTQ